MSLVDSRYRAPGARLVDTNGTTVLQTTVDDLVSVSVTLVASGVSQCSVRLNNQSVDHLNHFQPVHPPWKYNKLETFRFGQRFGVQFSYDPNRDDTGTAGWQTLIFCRVTDIGFSFPAGGGAQMTLEAEDLLGLLKGTHSEDAKYRGRDEQFIVNDVLSRSGCGLTLADPQVARPTFSEPLQQVVHQKGTGFLQFLQPIVDRLDYEIFVDNQVATPADIQLHFEPARSLKELNAAPGQPAPGRVASLQWGRDIIDFSPKLRVSDQYQKATFRGPNPHRRDQVDGEVGVAEIVRDLHWEGSPAPLDAVAVAARYMRERSNNNDEYVLHTDVHGLDASRARVKAAAELRKRARELLTAQVSTFGRPDLVPGIHIDLTGLRPPFDGLYYCTKAVHTLDSGGYKTQLSLRRPGMGDPNLYLSQETAA